MLIYAALDVKRLCIRILFPLRIQSLQLYHELGMSSARVYLHSSSAYAKPITAPCEGLDTNTKEARLFTIEAHSRLRIYCVTPQPEG